MASEVFKLKSVDLDDTLLRGSRVSFGNAVSTKTIMTYPGEGMTGVKTGERSVEAEYLYQASVDYDDLRGYATFHNKINKVTGYTGPQDLVWGDGVRLQGDTKIYGVTGIIGQDLYLLENYVKSSESSPDDQSGVCAVRKYKLGSVKYEAVASPIENSNIFYNDDTQKWGYTGIQNPELGTAPKGTFVGASGMQLQFIPSTSTDTPDVASVLTTNKTLVSGNTSEVKEVSLSPIPYPGSPVIVSWGPKKGPLVQKTEREDYVINYSSDPTFVDPPPEYVNRQSAYIRFLGKLANEPQGTISTLFQGSLAVSKDITADTPRQVTEIIPGSEDIKVGSTTVYKSNDYLINYQAGIVKFVGHANREELVGSVVRPNRLAWDGISVIRGTESFKSADALVIPGITGIAGATGYVYYEDTEESNLGLSTDYLMDTGSGAMRLRDPLEKDQSILVSYYVEGEDRLKEVVPVEIPRLSAYPVVMNSLAITATYADGSRRVLIEGSDYNMAWLTGWVRLLPPAQGTSGLKSLEVAYTPMAPVNVILEDSGTGPETYKMTILGDNLKLVDEQRLQFKSNNTSVSVPRVAIGSTGAQYVYDGTITSVQSVVSDGIQYPVVGWMYDDKTRILKLDERLTSDRPIPGSTVLADYTFISDVLPYAPLQTSMMVLRQGGTELFLDGFDRTDIIKRGTVLRIDNLVPEGSFYFGVTKVSYMRGGTLVNLATPYPQDIVRPSFYTFDDNPTWVPLPGSAKIVGKETKSSETVRLEGSPLKLSNLIKAGTLLKDSAGYIYSILSGSADTTGMTLSIFPSLQATLKGPVYVTELPVRQEGSTDLSAQQFILSDPEPAFTVAFEPPEGFEGAGSVLVDGHTIRLTESINGTKNPVDYVYDTLAYGSVADLALAINDTLSTYVVNVPIGPRPPTYRPFVVTGYHLPEGHFSSDLIIPFEQADPVQLPYTFTITRELFKYSLPRLIKGRNTFEIPEVDRTGTYPTGTAVWFRCRVTDKDYLRYVTGAAFDGNKTTVTFGEYFPDNVINPIVKTKSDITYIPKGSTLLTIQGNTMTFSGTAPEDPVGTLVLVAGQYQRSVVSSLGVTGTYGLTLEESLSVPVVTQNDYVLFSDGPVMDWVTQDPINEHRMQPDTDYTVSTGLISLTSPLASYDRYSLNYMGLDTLPDQEGMELKVTCRYFGALPIGSRLDVYFDYQNRDQFYIQKLTERTFSNIVVVPQVKSILASFGGGGQGADTAAPVPGTPNYKGGILPLWGQLRDEQIKKQLYLKFFQWYKSRQRYFGAELQLGLGFKFAHSPSVALTSRGYSMADSDVEDANYSLTRLSDMDQIRNGFSKFFPVGYEGTQPKQYDRFSKEYLSWCECHAFNLRESSDINRGVLKAEKPYWNQGSDGKGLDFFIWQPSAEEESILSPYVVKVPVDDCTYRADSYTFLKTFSVGDQVKINGTDQYAKVVSIVSGTSASGQIYDLAYLDRSLPGVQNYSVDPVDDNRLKKWVFGDGRYGLFDIPKTEFIVNAPSDGQRVWVRRQQIEAFPMMDDSGTLGAVSIGGRIPELVRDTHQLKKPLSYYLQKLMFPFMDMFKPPKRFQVQILRDPSKSTENWETLDKNAPGTYQGPPFDPVTTGFAAAAPPVGPADLSKLNMFQEQNMEAVMDTIRYNNTLQAVIPPLPPFTFFPVIQYGAVQRSDQGLWKEFYISLENVYDANVPGGYYQALVFRAKNRNAWFRIMDSDVPISEQSVNAQCKKNSGDTVAPELKALVGVPANSPAITSYGYPGNITYKNFYDPQHLYLYYLKERQAWQLEYKILSDLYDHSDKIARAFKYGELNRVNSEYQSFLVQTAEILASRIPVSFSILDYLISPNGPLNLILRPDGVNDENDASSAISTTYMQTVQALQMYSDQRSDSQYYYDMTATGLASNRYVWTNDYIRWVLSLEEGYLYQKQARALSKVSSVLPVGLYVSAAIRLHVVGAGLLYGYYNVFQDGSGKSISIQVFSDAGKVDLPTVKLYTYSVVNGVSYPQYKTLNQVCSEINALQYRGSQAVEALNVFSYNEYQIVQNLVVLNRYVPFDLTIDATNVADHRASDPRVLYLNRNIEDRIYTQTIRESAAISLVYSGGLYGRSKDTSVLTIVAKRQLPLVPNQGKEFESITFGTKTDADRHGVFHISCDAIRLHLPPEVVEDFYYPLYDMALGRYLTVQELADKISSTVDIYSKELIFEVQVGAGFGGLSTSDATLYKYLSSATDTGDVFNATLTFYFYMHVDTSTDNVDTDKDNATYRVYEDSGAHKLLDITFDNIYANGSNLIKTNEPEQIFTFNLQKSEGAWKTIVELSTEISNFSFRGLRLFSGTTAIYTQAPGSGLSCQYIVADNAQHPIGFDSQADIFADPYLDTINPVDPRNVTNAKNAYFAWPMYVSNGNTGKNAIEGVPVAGQWSSDEYEDVLRIRLLRGTSWSIEYKDYKDGEYKNYSPPPPVLAQIDSTGVITQDEYNLLPVAQNDQPTVSIIKTMVFRAVQDGLDTPIELSVDLRENTTINDLVTILNGARFTNTGVYDPINGEVQNVFQATLVGTPRKEGVLHSFEVDVEYVPVVRTFTVSNVTTGSGAKTLLYKEDQLIGWNLGEDSFKIGSVKTMKVKAKKYSPEDHYLFTVASPAEARERTLNAFPQGFRTDILAMDAYCWDGPASSGVRRIVVKDNWMYFRSANITYILEGDLGQPDTTLGYGIPLAGSGHDMAPDTETVAQLLTRINSNGYVNQWFYVDLRFTRSSTDPGYFVYGYLPDQETDLVQAQRNDIPLADDNVMIVSAGTGYNFSNSTVSLVDSMDSLTITTDFTYSVSDRNTIAFNRTDSDTIQEVVTLLSGMTAQGIAAPLYDAQVFMFSGSQPSVNLKPGTYPLSTATYTAIPSKLGPPLMLLKLTADSGVGPYDWSITGAQLTVVNSGTNPRLTISCTITYSGSFNLINQDISGYTVQGLSDFLGTFRIFSGAPSFFTVEPTHRFYADKPANRLKDLLGTSLSPAVFSMDLSWLTGMRLLCCTPTGKVTVDATRMLVTGSGTYSTNLPTNNDLYGFVDSVRGDYTSGLIKIDVVPYRVEGVSYGRLRNIGAQVMGNPPGHVYFGIMGDIRWVQVSDYNLHMQANAVKRRLGMPADGYTPEDYTGPQYPLALDNNHFLSWLRVTRYKQIRDSVINEGQISNQYFWLYLKFHREFGCDQRVIALTKKTLQDEDDQATLSAAG